MEKLLVQSLLIIFVNFSVRTCMFINYGGTLNASQYEQYTILKISSCHPILH